MPRANRVGRRLVGRLLVGRLLVRGSAPIAPVPGRARPAGIVRIADRLIGRCSGATDPADPHQAVRSAHQAVRGKGRTIGPTSGRPVTIDRPGPTRNARRPVRPAGSDRLADSDPPGSIDLPTGFGRPHHPAFHSARLPCTAEGRAPILSSRSGQARACQTASSSVPPPPDRACRRPTRSAQTRNSWPGGDPWRRRSLRGAGRVGSWSCPSDARPWSGSSCTPPACASRSSRWRAGRLRHWPASMATKVWPWSWSPGSLRPSTMCWLGLPSEASHRSSSSSIRSRIHTTSARSCAARRARACTVCCSRSAGRRRSRRRPSRRPPVPWSICCSARWMTWPPHWSTSTVTGCGSPGPIRTHP